MTTMDAQKNPLLITLTDTAFQLALDRPKSMRGAIPASLRQDYGSRYIANSVTAGQAAAWRIRIPDSSASRPNDPVHGQRSHTVRPAALKLWPLLRWSPFYIREVHARNSDNGPRQRGRGPLRLVLVIWIVDPSEPEEMYPGGRRESGDILFVDNDLRRTARH